MGFTGLLFDANCRFPAMSPICWSPPRPTTHGDPVLRLFAGASCRSLRRLSGWAICQPPASMVTGVVTGWMRIRHWHPTHCGGERRLAAEQAGFELGLPVHLFRLAGIYGPGRNQLLSGNVMARQSASSSPARFSAAFMWTILPACWQLPSQGRIRSVPIMSVTMSPARRRRWWPLPQNSWGLPLAAGDSL